MIEVLKNQAVIAVLPPFLRVRVERLGRSAVGYRLARGAFWSTAGEVASRTLTMLSSFVIARSLGRVSFGELGIIYSTLGMFGTLAGFGLGMTATKYVAQFKVADPTRAGRVIGVATIVSFVSGTALALLMVLLGPWLAAHTLAAPHLGPLLQVGSLLLFLGAISGAQTGALSGFEAFRRLAAINLWTGCWSFALLIVGTVGWGLSGAVWALVISRVINCILAHRALQQEAANCGVVISHTSLGAEWKVLGTYSIPALMTSLVVMGVYWVCNALLVNSAGGYAQMGMFNAANQWFNTLIILPTTLGQAVFPVLTEGLHSGNNVRSGRVLTFSMGVNALITIPFAILGAFLSPMIMSWYGPEFHEAWPTLVIVFVTAALLAIQTPVGHVIMASGRMWLGTIMNLAWGAVFIALTWMLLSRGAEGLALARLFAYLAHATWTFGFALLLIRQIGRHTVEAR
jgi:O-antigen/teichoic acid export membrane protein